MRIKLLKHMKCLNNGLHQEELIKWWLMVFLIYMVGTLQCRRWMGEWVEGKEWSHSRGERAICTRWPQCQREGISFPTVRGAYVFAFYFKNLKLWHLWNVLFSPSVKIKQLVYDKNKLLQSKWTQTQPQPRVQGNGKCVGVTFNCQPELPPTSLSLAPK